MLSSILFALSIMYGIRTIAQETDATPTTYEVTINYDGDDPNTNAALCSSGVIPLAPVPFQSEAEVIGWLNILQMCYFAFVNEQDAATYRGILANIASEDIEVTMICWDEDCVNPLAQDVVDDITTLSGFVDIHEQKYNVDEWTANSFKVSGVRVVKIEDGIDIAGFANNVNFENEFEEKYTLNEDGTLHRRDILTVGQLAQRLKEGGHIKYVQFARSVGQILDVPDRLEFKYVDENGEDAVYYVHLSNIVIILVLFLMVAFVLVSFCWTVKIMMSYLCAKQKRIHVYSKVNQQTDSES